MKKKPLKRKNNPLQDPVILGKFGAPFGVRGWIKLYSYTEPADNILKFSVWQLKSKNEWQPINITEIKPHGDAYIAKINHIESPETARAFTNGLIGVDPSELPELPSGEFYWDELIGLPVINLEGQSLGKVHHIFETGANDVIVTRDENQRERLIPYIDSVIQSIDLEKNQILADWDPDF